MKPYQTSTVFRVIAIVLLFLALGNQPYGFYILLRWTVSLASLYTGYLYHNVKLRSFAWLFFVLGVLFNPLVPIYLTKDTWQVIDVIVGIIFIYTLFRKELKYVN